MEAHPKALGIADTISRDRRQDQVDLLLMAQGLTSPQGRGD